MIDLQSIIDAAPVPTDPSGRGSDYAHLPHETLLQIFEKTQPASQYECNTSVAIGPRNPWLENLRTKKAIALVCKAWYGPATAVLYADVVLRRMGQVAALARTFREHRPVDSDCGGLPDLVRHISLDACIVLPMFADVVREDLEFVLQACTHLQSFSCRAAERFSIEFLSECFGCYYHLVSGDSVLLGSQVRAMEGMNVQHVYLAPPEMCFGQLTPLLASAAHLTKLSLGTFPDWDANEVKPERLPSLHFPVLEDLQLPFTHPSEGLQDYVRARWRLPALTALTLVDCHEYTAKGLLEAHGAQLKYLHFHMFHHDDDSDSEEVQEAAPPSIFYQLAHLCPAVEHLVIPVFYAQTADVRSPTLRYLDFLCGHDPSLLAITLSETAHIPRLMSTRSILCDETFFPRACHPSLIPADKPDMEIIYFFNYRRVVQTRTFVKYDGGTTPQHLYYEDGEEIEDSDDDSDSGKTVYEDGEGEEEDDGDVHGTKDKPMPEDEGSLYEPSSGSEDEDTSDDDSWSTFEDEQVRLPSPQNYEEYPEFQNDRDEARRYLLERFSLSQGREFTQGDVDEEDDNEEEPEGVEGQGSVAGHDDGSSNIV